MQFCDRLIDGKRLADHPHARSVVDKQASAMLVLVFNRCLVVTAIMTSAFKTIVTGQVMILKTVMKTSQP